MFKKLASTRPVSRLANTRTTSQSENIDAKAAISTRCGSNADPRQGSTRTLDKAAQLQLAKVFCDAPAEWEKRALERKKEKDEEMKMHQPSAELLGEIDDGYLSKVTLDVWKSLMLRQSTALVGKPGSGKTHNVRGLIPHLLLHPLFSGNN